MCGRYALNISGEDLAIEFAAGVKDAGYTPSNWNISPTTVIPFISSNDERGIERSIQTARWGLIPSWANDASRQANAINTRVESIAEKILNAPNIIRAIFAYSPNKSCAKLPVPVRVDKIITGILNHAFKHQYLL